MFSILMFFMTMSARGKARLFFLVGFFTYREWTIFTAPKREISFANAALLVLELIMIWCFWSIRQMTPNGKDR